MYFRVQNNFKSWFYVLRILGSASFYEFGLLIK